MGNLLITWHGHSCFTVSYNNYSIVLDPYAPGSVPGLDPLSLTANRVLCSHEHSDHGFTEAVTLKESKASNPFNILKIDTWHDDAQGALRGTNRIHILEAGDFRVAHMGDLGCALTNQQMDQLKHLDAILIPVGGYYTIDAVQAKALVTALSPRVVIPMHYRSDTFGYPVIGRLEEYTSHCNNVVTYNTNTLILDKHLKNQTAVLTLAC